MRIAVAGGVSAGARQALDILHRDGKIPVLDKESIVFKMYNRPQVITALKEYFGKEVENILIQIPGQPGGTDIAREIVDRNKLKRKIIDTNSVGMVQDIERITGPIVSNIIEAFHKKYPGTTAVETPGLLEYDVVHSHTEKFGEKFHPILLLFCDPQQQRKVCFDMIESKMREHKYTEEEIYKRIDLLLTHELPNKEKVKKAQERGDYIIDTTDLTRQELREKVHEFMAHYNIPLK